MHETCLCGNPKCEIAYGFCHCGCGQRTSIAPQTARSRKLVRGEPMHYIKGHGGHVRADRHTLTAIDTQNHRAICRLCGEVTVRRDASRKNGWKCSGQITDQHFLKNIDAKNKTAWCLGCRAQVDLVPRGGGDWACKTNRRAKQVAYREENREALRARSREWHAKNGRSWRLRRHYGITHAEFEAKVTAQGGVCRICGGPPDFHGRLVVDHCHDSGITRDLLCNRCNRVLGMIGDDPAIADIMSAYLKRWSQA